MQKVRRACAGHGCGSRVQRGAALQGWRKHLANAIVLGCSVWLQHTVRLRLNGFGPPFLDRFATVSDRFSGSWCRFLESWG